LANRSCGDDGTRKKRNMQNCLELFFWSLTWPTYSTRTRQSLVLLSVTSDLRSLLGRNESDFGGKPMCVPPWSPTAWPARERGPRLCKRYLFMARFSLSFPVLLSLNSNLRAVGLVEAHDGPALSSFFLFTACVYVHLSAFASRIWRWSMATVDAVSCRWHCPLSDASHRRASSFAKSLQRA
jgi:hypothetical protein